MYRLKNENEMITSIYDNIICFALGDKLFKEATKESSIETLFKSLT